jgi:CheY-like chemotaxis protein
VRAAQSTYKKSIQRKSLSSYHPELSLCTAADPLHGKLVVVVTDTGAGISIENQKRLFKEIVQFSPEKLQSGGGSGLGLWITGGIMNLHDGNISVSSQGEGQGSSFTVEMPMIRRPPKPDDNKLMKSLPSSAPKGVPMLQSNGRSHSLPTLNCGSFDSDATIPPQTPVFRLLVVDDSRLNRKMLLKCLRADGHDCIECADGVEAVAAVKEAIDYKNGGNGKPFDAILMDFIMPNMDGPTATQEIRALGYTAPIFGVTGNGEKIFSSFSLFLFFFLFLFLFYPFSFFSFFDIFDIFIFLYFHYVLFCIMVL